MDSCNLRSTSFMRTCSPTYCSADADSAINGLLCSAFGSFEDDQVDSLPRMDTFESFHGFGCCCHSGNSEFSVPSSCSFPESLPPFYQSNESVFHGRNSPSLTLDSSLESPFADVDNFCVCPLPCNRVPLPPYLGVVSNHHDSKVEVKFENPKFSRSFELGFPSDFYSFDSDNRTFINGIDNQTSFNGIDNQTSFNGIDNQPSFNGIDNRNSFNGIDKRNSFKVRHSSNIDIDQSIPFEFGYFPNIVGLPSIQQKETVKTPFGRSRWGLTVEQRKTEQTTFRYFPGGDPSLWQGWGLDMPPGEDGGSLNQEEDGPETDGDAPSESAETSGGKSSGGSKRVEWKKCGVCGDRALGYNFNAITCESCKAFFRRNALKNKEFRCPFSDECEVTAVTRRFCQRCRLKKCIDVGMKKEWIMSEDEKKKKKRKIEENRARKFGDPYQSPLTPAAEEALEKPSKPQAVVVGRVRTNAKSPFKKMKKCPDADGSPSPESAGTSGGKLAGSEMQLQESGGGSSVDLATLDTSLTLDFVPNQIVLTLTPPSSQMAIPSPPQPDSFPGPHILLSPTNDVSFKLCSAPPETHSTYSPLTFATSSGNSLHPPDEGLVANLLRAHSQSSAEEEVTVRNTSDGEFEHNVTKNDSEGNSVPMPLVAVKREPNNPNSYDETLLESSCVEEVHPSSQTPVTLLPDSLLLQAPSCSFLPQKEFHFDPKETLQILQPGCRGFCSSSSGSGSDVMNSILNSAIDAEYSGLTLLRNSSDSLELNSMEILKINELLEANRGLTAPLCEDANFKDLPNPSSLINVINLTEIAIRRLIKMAKRIRAFKNLCQEDQLALLKGGCTELMILRSVYAYDPDKDEWKIQQDHQRYKNIKLKVLKAAQGNVYEEHKRFLLAFEPEWRHDLQIMALLSAIALFSPQRQNTVHQKAIDHEQKSYFFLLKRYLESRYGGCEGKTNYYRLLSIIGHLHILNEDHVRVFLQVNPKDVEPLLIEIFDLKRS